MSSVGLVLAMAVAGCTPSPPPPPRDGGPDGTGGVSSAQNSIHAQGRLEPAGGIIPIMAAPGDLIRTIDVKVGASVGIGTPLATLASLEAKKAELTAAEAKLAEAKNQLAVAKATAEARVRAAEISLRSAQLKRDQAKMIASQLEQADRELAEAERVTDQLRSAASDPDVAALIGQGKLNRQELDLQKAQLDREMKGAEAESAEKTSALALEAANQELTAAQAALKAAEDSATLTVIEKQIEIIKLQMKASHLESPVDGDVISIDASPGQPTSVTPIMQIAKRESMLCLAEVDVAFLPYIKKDAPATIRSPAITTELKGNVKLISKVMGVPRLANPSPLARSDWRAVVIEIELNEGSVAAARDFINLQVDVEIEGTAMPTNVVTQASTASAPIKP